MFSRPKWQLFGYWQIFDVKSSNQRIPLREQSLSSQTWLDLIIGHEVVLWLKDQVL